ncbi:MAG: MFS transporter [Acidimicrobiales bacterium]
MARLTAVHVVDDGGLARLAEPRSDLLIEAADAQGRAFTAAVGPFTSYERHLDVADGPDGSHTVTETTEFRLAVPVWRVALTPLVKRRLRHRHDAMPWWAPPDHLDTRAAHGLGVLCLLSLVTGYLGTLLSQTIAFAVDEFEASDSAQGATLAAVRIGIVISVVLVALADRRGRRKILVATTVAACVVSSTAALSVDLWSYGTSQAVARGLSTAMALLIGVIAAEETPAGSRAYAASVLTLSAALGSGMVVWFLPLTDLGVRAWRLLYLLPLAIMPFAWAWARWLPETRRFEIQATAVRAKRRFTEGVDRGRFILLAVSAFLIAAFAAPASQFQNDFLKDERGFSGARISAFQLITNTPAGIGVFVAGRFADTRGRKVVATIGLIGGAAFTIGRYGDSGWPMWMWGTLATIIGSATIPALGVYGPELFGTANRGGANGMLGAIGVVGSSLGLLIVGFLSDELGGFGPTFAIMAIGPLIVAVLVIVAFPETARRELEDLNPGDAAGPTADPTPS